MYMLGRVMNRQNYSPMTLRKIASLCLTIVLPITIFVVSGCSTFRNHEPEWVRNPKTVYPENKFLVAVGEGDTRQDAENVASANLSRIFEAHIESDERMVDKVWESNDDFVRKTDVTTDINILSSQTLINIQHAEAWKDDDRRYHAVAYLNRRETGMIYLDKIEERSAHVESLLGYAQHSSNLLEKYALLRAAVRVAIENDVLLRQLKVIHSPTASAAAPSYSINEIEKAASDCAKQIRVAIQIDGDTDGRMANCLKELVTRYGFVVGQPATIDMQGRVSIDDTGKRAAGLVFFLYNLTVQIQDDQGNVLAAINEKGREAVTSPSEARTRCYRTLENAIKVSGIRSFDTYFDSLVEHTN